MVREVKDRVDEVEKNCLFEEIRDKAAIVVEERMKMERRVKGALKMDTGIVKKSVRRWGCQRKAD